MTHHQVASEMCHLINNEGTELHEAPSVHIKEAKGSFYIGQTESEFAVRHCMNQNVLKLELEWQVVEPLKNKPGLLSSFSLPK